MSAREQRASARKRALREAQRRGSQTIIISPDGSYRDSGDAPGTSRGVIQKVEDISGTKQTITVSQPTTVTQPAKTSSKTPQPTQPQYTSNWRQLLVRQGVGSIVEPGTAIRPVEDFSPPVNPFTKQPPRSQFTPGQPIIVPLESVRATPRGYSATTESGTPVQVGFADPRARVNVPGGQTTGSGVTGRQTTSGEVFYTEPRRTRFVPVDTFRSGQLDTQEESQRRIQETQQSTVAFYEERQPGGAGALRTRRVTTLSGDMLVSDQYYTLQRRPGFFEQNVQAFVNVPLSFAGSFVRGAEKSFMDTYYNTPRFTTMVDARGKKVYQDIPFSEKEFFKRQFSDPDKAVFTATVALAPIAPKIATMFPRLTTATTIGGMTVGAGTALASDRPGKYGEALAYVALAYPELRKQTIVTAETFVARLRGGGQIKTTVLGLNVGTRGVPLVSRTTLTTRTIKATYDTETSTAFFSAPKLTTPVRVEQFAVSVAQPLAPATGKVLQRTFALTPTEVTRIREAQFLASRLQSTKGMTVKEWIADVEGVPQSLQKDVAREVEIFTGQGKEGYLFGSIVSKRAPDKPTLLNTLSPEFKLDTLQTKPLGDIDVQFPKQSVEQIRPKITALTKRLQRLGLDVEESPQGVNTIQFRGTGNKFLEAKSGINQESLGLDDVAPEGFLGVRFKNTLAQFGGTKSITLGEQGARQFAGALIFSPGLPGETASFSLPGILGKQGNTRGLKDTAGAIVTAKADIDLRASSWNPLTRFRSRAEERSLARFFKSYSPEQQTDIIMKAQARTSTQIPLLSSERSTATLSLAQRSATLRATPSLTTNAFSQTFSSLARPTTSQNTQKDASRNVLGTQSPQLLPSPKTATSVSPVVSGASVRSPRSVSPSRGSLSPRSISPSTSPRSPSPSASPRSPSPSTSPRSISPSVRSPSPRSPSPRSPSSLSSSYSSYSPKVPSSPPGVPRGEFFRRTERKRALSPKTKVFKKEKTRYTPTLFEAVTGRAGTPTLLGTKTGLGSRPVGRSTRRKA